ncbi:MULTISPECIES: hypothetical protein [Myroides]|uniref:hypothetical protein n=1 Tax=Myroides TaxID=76831 RepID=UPI0015FE608C|nr:MULTISPECIES: hypothetical protein [Myroides]MBB1139292.1 hypothetical protein [Myroides sp. WP-1]MDM1499641.1 hypothetical protein [Myroides odoratimimus]
MINKLKYATIADIGIYDLLFYEEAQETKLIDFCTQNGITFLPSRNRKQVYKLLGSKFELQDLSPKLCIKPYERIFDEETLTKFSFLDHNEIHFIVENDLIKGVVHIIDYNSEFIQVELYRALFKFEVHLRTLLVENNFTNDDFINWVRFKSETDKDKNSKEHWQKRLDIIAPNDQTELEKVINKRKEFKPFQTFYLLELMRFASDKKVIDKRIVDINKIATLRNQIAHSNDLTTFSKEKGQMVYNYKNLNRYVRQINAFFKAYEYFQLRIEKLSV